MDFSDQFHIEGKTWDVRWDERRSISSKTPMIVTSCQKPMIVCSSSVKVTSCQKPMIHVVCLSSVKVTSCQKPMIVCL